MSALEGRRSRYPRKVGFHQTWSLVILEAGFHFVPERHAIVARRFIAGFGHPYDLRTGGTLEVGSRLLRIRRPTPWGQVKCRQCVKSLGRQAIRETVVRERSNLTGHRRSRDQEKWGFHQVWSLAILEAGFHFVSDGHAIVASPAIYRRVGHPYDPRPGGTLEA
jgi:hypothetical protein